ncbi:MAG: helix-turn-helix transcriptional regulator [Chloroflexota bacterium]|nr:helix-turn-helix transcriptional regulator [Chloroflexota bacterium]
MLGQLVKRVREELGLQPNELGKPQFSAAYVEALEQGALRPSRMVLELLAKRLNLSPDKLLALAAEAEEVREPRQDQGEAVGLQPDPCLYEEDLQYQLDCATTLVQQAEIEQALELINAVEAVTLSFGGQVSVRGRYRIPYLRGMAYLQAGKPDAAQSYLETALSIVGLPITPGQLVSNDIGRGTMDRSRQNRSLITNTSATLAAAERSGTAKDSPGRPHTERSGVAQLSGAGERTPTEEMPEVEARIRNLLGVAYYMQKRLAEAEVQHISCLHASEDRKIPDTGLRFSIYRNLTNDHWASGKYEQAITIGREALRLFQDLADPLRLAGLEWTLAVCYKASGERAYAKLHAQSALAVYRAREVPIATATVAINLAELLIEDAQYVEAEPLLLEAESLLQRPETLAKSKAGAGVALTALSPQTAIPLTLSNLYQNRARLALAHGQFQEAAQHASQSIELSGAVYRAEANAEPDVGKAKRASIHPTHYYSQALHVGALVEEATGNYSASDQLFEQALAVVEGTGFERAHEAILRSYADVLKARRDFERAAKYMERAAAVRMGAR